MNFTETAACMNRLACFRCRNNDNFRKRAEKRFGPWECPDGIPIGASIEEMPEKTRNIMKHKEETINKRRENLKKVLTAIQELEMMFPEAESQIEIIKNFVFPREKKPTNCQFYTTKIGTTEETCCGGKVKVVDEYGCSKHKTTTDKKCTTCMDFRRA